MLVRKYSSGKQKLSNIKELNISGCSKKKIAQKSNIQSKQLRYWNTESLKWEIESRQSFIQSTNSGSKPSGEWFEEELF